MSGNWLATIGSVLRRVGALALVLVPLSGCSREPELAPYANAAGKSADEWAQLDREFEKMATGYDADTGAPSITVAELQAMLAAGETVVLLDTRDAVEFNAAHLPAARLTPPGELSDTDFANLPDGAIVVTYCTAGLRSGRVAVKLAARLNRDTRNLHGGIVGWFNAGGQVVDAAGTPVNQIHPYGDTWGRHVHPRE